MSSTEQREIHGTAAGEVHQAPGGVSARPAEKPTVSFGVIVALEARVATEPEPVHASDGRWHLVYEIYLLNTAPAPQQLKLLEVTNAHDDRVLLRFDTEAALRAVMTSQGEDADTRGPNAGGAVFVDLSADTRDGLPAQLAHRIESSIMERTFAFRGALSTVSRHQAVRISAPLVGPGYLNENSGPGRSDHTRAVLTIDGTRWLAQRYAIDWIRIDDRGRPYVGDWRVNTNWLIFGDPVVSVSAGKVVEVLTTMPENTPGQSPKNELTPFTALGNHVIVDMGDDRFVVYAHLQPGSVPEAVAVGRRVRPGQRLGRVGNTGSSMAPHLHFHVTEGSNAVASNGAPWVFDGFRFVARALNADDLNADDPAPVATLDRTGLPQHRTDEMPIKGDVVDFPGSREAG